MKGLRRYSQSMNLRVVGTPRRDDLGPTGLRVVDLDDPFNNPMTQDEHVLCHCGQSLGHQDPHGIKGPGTYAAANLGYADAWGQPAAGTVVVRETQG